MANRQIRLFNPFSLQLGADSDHHRQIQQVIWYAESRFRQALVIFHDAPDPKQRWMQSALREELVSHTFNMP
jgi:hypothetical protein